MAWLLDLDGVVWLGDQPIPGSVEAVRRLRAAGVGVLFVTNNSSATVAHYMEKLERVGLPSTPEDLVTSAQAAATLVSGGERVLACAGEGVVEALIGAGARVVRADGAGGARGAAGADGAAGDGGAAGAEGAGGADAAGLDPSFDAVVVGWHRTFDYRSLTAAARAVWGGARLVGTNDDASYPTPDGPLPGGGSILAAVAYATGATPVLAGKPHQPIADLVLARIGRPTVFVGDRPSTDGLMASRLGVPFVRVRSGVDEPEDPSAPVTAHHDVPDLAAAVDQLLS